MENQPAIFSHPDFGNIRTAGTADKPLFCLADVCRALDLDNPSYIKKRLDEKGVFNNYTLTNGGSQKLLYINEPNLYKCIFQSRKKEAQMFQDWIFEEVLPSIRKTGAYSVDYADELVMPYKEHVKVLLSMYKNSRDDIRLISKLYDMLLDELPETSTSTKIGEKYGLEPWQVNSMMERSGMIYRTPNGYKPTELGKSLGLTRQSTYTDENGNPAEYLTWTRWGNVFIDIMVYAKLTTREAYIVFEVLRGATKPVETTTLKSILCAP